MTVNALLTFSITFLLTLSRLAAEKEIPQVNYNPSFYRSVNSTESINLPVTSGRILDFCRQHECQ